MTDKTISAVQDFYPDHFAHCFGCGRLNEHGYRFQTRWEGDETVTRFTPSPDHTAIPGFVYGGLLASLADCHSTASGAAALYRAEGREYSDAGPSHRCVTGTLSVRFRRPTPLGPELAVRGRILDVLGRKVTIASQIFLGDEVTVEADAVVIKVSDDFGTR
ncbi:MAG TPA: PaaI family thioesterase [Acidimicrobiales bacterium]|nr:PaaI family thioesterase [Acidimicrobiales bacterium]